METENLLQRLSDHYSPAEIVDLLDISMEKVFEAFHEEIYAHLEDLEVNL